MAALSIVGLSIECPRPNVLRRGSLPLCKGAIRARNYHIHRERLRGDLLYELTFADITQPLDLHLEYFVNYDRDLLTFFDLSRRRALQAKAASTRSKS